ncbi:MAG: pyridoxamine 5'-phosphate oxidase family protein [Candidatus Thorarchaeota archaeon]
MSPKQKDRIKKILKSVYFYSLTTSWKDIPQTTIVLPRITEDWKILIISHKKRKKVQNIQNNPNVWLIADKTGLFRIPHVIYIKGTAKICTLSVEKVNEFASLHSWFSRRLIRRLVRDEIKESVLIEITPSKFTTVGIYGKVTETVSFRAPS